MELLRQRRNLRRLGILAIVAASCSLSCRAALRVPDGFQPGGGWPMFGGDSGHTGLCSSRLRPPLQLLWRFRTRGPIVASPVVVGGVVCLGSLDKKFYFLSARDGRLCGFFKTGSSISASPAIGGQTVFFGTELGDDAVYALDLSSGDLRWKADIRDVSTSLTLAHGTVLVSSGSGSFYALSTEDGRELWQFQTGGRANTPAAVEGGMVYFGSDDGHLYALEAEDGREVWRRELGGAVWSSPIAYEGQVYVGSFDGEIYAVREVDGEVIWSYQTGGVVSSSPAIRDDIVYVGSDDGKLYALDAASGAPRWSFVGESSICSSPLVSRELVVFGTRDGAIYGLDGRTGELKWSHQTGRAIVSSPAAWEGRIFIGSMDGYLYAFGEGTADSSASIQAIP